MLTTRDGPAVIDAKTMVENGDFCSSEGVPICHNVRCGKTGMVSLPDGEEIL